MDRSITSNNAVSRETFLPGQLFVFGGFVLRANSTGHLEQIDSYAPCHQIRFGSLNYVTDIRGDLIFEGFTTSATAPHLREEGPSDPPSDPVQGSTLMTALALDPERTTLSEDGRVNLAGLSPIKELLARDPDASTPSANPDSNKTHPVIGRSDTPLDINSELSRSASVGLVQVV